MPVQMDKPNSTNFNRETGSSYVTTPNPSTNTSGASTVQNEYTPNGDYQIVYNGGTPSGYIDQDTGAYYTTEQYANIVSGNDFTGAPERPDYNSLLTDSGNLKRQYTLDTSDYAPNYWDIASQNTLAGAPTVRAGQIDSSQFSAGPDVSSYDLQGKQGADLLFNLAQQGPTAWANASKSAIDLGRQDTIDAGSRQAAGAQAQAYNAMSALGGAGTGSRGNIANEVGREVLKQKQQAYRDAMKGKSSIDIAGLEAQYGAMDRYAGMETDVGLTNLSDQNLASRTGYTTLADLEKSQAELDTDVSKAQADIDMRGLMEQLRLMEREKEAKSSAQAYDDEYNLETTLGDISSEQDFDMEAWIQELNRWAALQQAQ